MRFPTRTTISWFLVGLLALVSGVGEGFHLIPGSGHVVELPGGYLFVGLVKPKSTFCLDNPSPSVGCPQGESPPCYDEDECPICRLSGQGQSFAEGICLLPVLPVADDLPAIAPCVSHADTPLPFDARAPPVA